MLLWVRSQQCTVIRSKYESGGSSESCCRVSLWSVTETSDGPTSTFSKDNECTECQRKIQVLPVHAPRPTAASQEIKLFRPSFSPDSTFKKKITDVHKWGLFLSWENWYLKCQFFCHLLPPDGQPEARGETLKPKSKEDSRGLWYQLVILGRSLRLLALDASQPLADLPLFPVLRKVNLP